MLYMLECRPAVKEIIKKNQIAFIQQYVNAKGIILDESITDHVFSYRLYGLRKYKTKLEKDKSLKGSETDNQNSSR